MTQNLKRDHACKKDNMRLKLLIIIGQKHRGMKC